MSDVQTRPAASRGRGSGRGGRGGFASRGGRNGGRTNGADKTDSKSEVDNPSAFDDEGAVGELKKLYGAKTPLIQEMFPEWSEVDILFALQETDGDETEAVTRIAEGTISQWGEVSKVKKVSRAKAKDSTTPATNIDSSASISRPVRGGRIVSEGGRGRGRATERGGRGGRGRSSQPAPTNGARQTTKDSQPLSVPTEESPAWGSKTDDSVIQPTTIAIAPIDESPQVPAPPSNAPKTWASMLRQVAVPKPFAQPKEAPTVKPSESIEPLPPVTHAEPETEPEPTPEAQPEPEIAPEAPAEAIEEPIAAEVPTVIEPEVALQPSKDQLTETNLEQVADDSHPPATATVASTAADSWDPRLNAASATATPLSAAQQAHQASRPPATPTSNSGYATSALKATTDRATRTPSFQRRVLDQEEAVRMPGNREVDRTAVQFGAFNIGSEDDVDGDREEPETRAQPPAESPIAQPRTSLPPAAPQAAVPEAFSNQKTQAAPAPSVAPSATPATAPAAQPTSGIQPPPGVGQPQGQYSQYGQPGSQDASSFPQKSVDPFSQQTNTASTPNRLDGFPSQQTQQAQQPGGAFSSAPSEYSSYYTSDQQGRGPYSYYGQPYGQQSGQGHQEGVAGQQRSFSGYNTSQAENISQYPQSAGLHNQSRYELPLCGGNGNHPYYNNPYYSNYMGYGGHFGQGGYGGGPYGKAGMYGQPYGMSPQGPYEHASSPASGFAQSSLHRGDSGLGGSSLGGDYGARAGSAQSGNPGSLGGSGFGGIQDSFGRSGSSFPTQSSGQGYNASAQPSTGASTGDDLKPYGETKAGAGPSPSLGGARPGSATQNTSSQSGLPPPQSASQMGGYGGYPSHAQGHGLHGGSGYGMGGSGQHANNGFGSYGQAYGSYGAQAYGSGGQQQQQQQQQRGWGGNYH
ncbi:conserved hypothetical protein [Verticillium alfalfae VaMs.102]|uniref:RNA polymerase II degradation factor 1 n=1 Tax=Verticillium alfalfae (strain VaMs.102 / ATCC MYA-4576 / FGSC 10136) TaxID=526221 RepID=C9SNC4_VERA1|nr:conserved hypothetical protein [Verticillium alfalfae VaMs.102]EEY20289.1 conserved hypothetical protein [Verticillium alfalfae VaMs.102]